MRRLHRLLWFRRWSIRACFGVLVGLFVVAAVSAFVYVKVQTERDGRRAAVSEARFAARTAATQLGDDLELVRASVAQLAANPAIGNAFSKPEGCSLSFTGIAGKDRSHLDILRPDGTVACSSQPALVGTRQNAAAARQWLRRALVKPRVVAPMLDTATGGRMAVSSAPLPGGKGVVAGFVDLESVGPHLASLYSGGNPIELLVTSRDGRTVVARSIDPGRWLGASLAPTPFSELDGKTEGRDVDGVTRLYAQAGVRGVDWQLYVGQDKAAALAAGSRLEQRQLAIIVVGLAAIMLAAWAVYRHLVSPIRQLSRAVRATIVTSSSTPVPVFGPSEVTALGEDINGLIVAANEELRVRQRAEEAALASELNYRLLFENNPNPMWVFDLETLRFLAVNDAATRGYGYSRDEFLAMTIEDIRPPAEVGRLRSVLGSVPDAVRGHNEAGVWRHRRKDGTVIEAEVTSRPHRFEGRTARVVLAVDVTERIRNENAVLESEARYRELFENAFEPTATVTMDERITDVNAAFERVLGYTRAELIGTSLRQYMTPASREISARQTDRKLSGEVAGTTFEHEFIAKDRRSVILEVSSRVIEDGDGCPIGVQGTCRDITARKHAELEVKRLSDLNRHQALHDGLTGLPNRGNFRERVEAAIVGGGRDQSKLAVLLIDLDRFKEINDTLGHHYGDLLLVELARRLESVVRDADTIARLGGDEFGMLLQELGASSDLENALERVHDALQEPFRIDALPLFVEASIGVALFPAHGGDVDLLLQRADIAMYAAKETGAHYRLYSPELDRLDTASLALLSELPQAIRNRELTLHYQPKLDLGTGELRSVEALIRWQHPTRGLIQPPEFIPAAEKTGLIQQLTQFVLDEALAQCKRWEGQGRRLNVAVNLSMRNLHEASLPDDVEALLRKWDLPGDRLTLEITESAIVSDPTRTKATVEQLSALGCLISIDDFGIGYTSLAYLARLKLDQIKIDRSFVLNMDSDATDAAIVRSTITLAHDLGLEVIAEGVETRTASDTLIDLGCDTLQGFHISRPLPAEEIVQFLAQHSLLRRIKAEAAA